MKLSDLRPAPGSHKSEKRVGRGHGSGRGKTSGRGTKGQKARTGGNIHRAFNGGQTRLSKRLAFVRGLGNSNTPFRKNYAIVNLDDLADFDANSRIEPEDMVQHDLMTAARENGIDKFAQIRLAVLEVNGRISFFTEKPSAGAPETPNVG